jgi:hypothetical protein
MRRFSFVLLIGFFVFAPVFLAGGEPGETKVSMLLWNRYTSQIENNEFGIEMPRSEFALKRGYLRIEPTITDKIDGRFNLDFFSDETSNTGGGVRVKYAYLNFAEALPVLGSNICVGIIQHYFGFGYDWEYITIEQVLEEREGVAKSADYGIAFHGNLAGGKGFYALGVYNGEGYTVTGSDLDVTPELLANLRLEFVPSFTFGGSILYFTDADKFAAIGLARFSKGPVELRGEYLFQNKDDVKSTGFMVMPVFRLRELINVDVDIVGRFDMWDVDTDIDDDGHTRVIGGLNLNILRNAKDKPQVILQIQGQRTMYEGLTPGVNLLMVQLQWGFENIITQ